MRLLHRITRLFSYALILAVLLLTALLLATQYSPSSLEPLLERSGSYLLGRKLQVGELSQVTLSMDAAVEFRDLQLANPAWAGPGPMLSIGRLKLALNLPSLWQGGSIQVKELEVDALNLELLAPDGELPNWELPVKFSESDPEDTPADILFPVIIERAHLGDIHILYKDPDQDVDVSLERLQLHRNEATGLSDLSLIGQVNDLPLTSEGTIGPTAALQTGKQLELDLALTLGKLRMTSSGTVADTLALSGADLQLDVRAPRSRWVLDLLGLEGVGDGPLRIEGRLTDAAPGLSMELEGEVADFGLGLHGVIEQPVALQGINLEFYLDGPSMAEAGAAFDLAGLKAVPFELSGKLYRRDSVMTLEGARLRAEQGSLELSGTLPNFPEIDDWQANIEGRRLDLSILGPLVGVQGMPQLICDIDGQLRADDEGVELLEFQITDGDIKLLVNGVVGELPGYENTVLDVRFTGSDLTKLRSLFVMQTLPVAPFELSGRVSREADSWGLKGGRVVSQGFQLELSGEIDRLVEPQRIDARASFSSPDLAAALREYGVDLQTAAPVSLDLSAELDLADGGFQFSSVQGQFGAIALSGSGWLSTQEGLGGSRVTLKGRGDHLGEALASFAEAQLPARAFELDLDATYHAPLVSIDELQLRVGTHQLSGELSLEGSGDEQLARGNLSLEGESLQDLLSIAGLDLEVTDGDYRATAGLELSTRHLSLQSLQINSLDSDISGEAHLEFGEVPRLDVTLQSEKLYLPFLLPDLAEAEQQAGAAEAEVEADLMQPTTRAEMKDRVIPDTPLPLTWINRVDGHWRYSVNQLSAREGLHARVNFDAVLESGLLQTRELAWDGPVSQGWVDLAIDTRQGDPNINLELATNRIPMIWLFSGKEAPKQQSTYRARLAATGTTLREAAASLNGALILRAQGAQISNNGLDLVLGDVVGSVFDRLNPTTQAEAYTEIECMAGAMRARNGILSIVPGMVLRTDKVDILSHGVLDLNTEGLNIAFNTRSRKGIGISAGKAITPYLKIAGNLAHPWVTLDPEAVAIAGTVAVATAGLSVLAEGLYDRWIATATNPCKDLYEKTKLEADYQQLLALPGPGGRTRPAMDTAADS